uniref:RNA-dependent RNA polymerase n=1 Tax=Soybean thrips nege-like virus 1 TaxID=2802957 RepID=A0A7T8FZP5_9VIRU|nr:RNA-dependent RNA polymerase [Soybean thrips nege-like virus 1]
MSGNPNINEAAVAPQRDNEREITSHSSRAIVDQLRQNTAFEYKGIQDAITKKMVTAMFNDERVLDINVEATLSEVRKDLDNKVNQKKIFVYQKVTKEDQIKLKNHFHMFDLDFTKATDTSGHSYWRAFRLLSEKKMLYEAKINPHSRPINGYNCVYKDVGGNPTTHVNRKEQYVHTCAPILSNNDDKRKSAYKDALRRRSRYDNDYVYRLHLTQDSRVICENKSQHCNITAETLIFLHSSYDMSPRDIADSMHRANALTARGCFHFNPRVIVEDCGTLYNGLCFKKFVKNNRMKIRFFFENDNQEGYEHDWLNYLSLIRTFRIKSEVSGTTRYYNVQFDTSNDDVAYFTIRRSINGSIPASSPYRVFTNPYLTDKFILYYWRWETLNSGYFFQSLSTHMKPVRIAVPKKLFQKLMSFADTLPESKFTVKNILIAGTSFNTREIISGQNVGNPEPIDSTDMKHLAHAIFLLTYISNFECSKTLSTLVSQEDDVRELSEKTYARRWLSKQVRRVVRAFGFGGETHSGEFHAITTNLTEGDCVQTTIFKKMCADMRSEASVSRKFDTFVEKKLCQFMTVEEELDLLLMDEEKCDRGYTSENIANDFIDIATVREQNLIALTNERVTNVTFGKEDMKNSPCLHDLQVVPNESDGHCVFKSIIDSGMYCCSPTELRRRMLTMPALENMRNSFAQRQLLSVFDGSAAGYGDVETILLASLDSTVGVCVHTNGRNYVYGNEPRKHFMLANGHCEYMKIVHNFDAVPTVRINEIMSDATDYDSQNRIVAFRTFMNCNNPTKTKFKKNLSVALNACWPVSELGNGNYVSRDGLRLAEINERYFSEHNFDCALVVGGPGGEVQFLAERKSCRIFGITDVEKDDYLACIDFPCFTQLQGFTCDGAIDSERNIFHYRTHIRREFPRGVDFFCSTKLAFGEDDSTEKNSVSMGWKILLCFCTLSRGGSAVFAFDDFLQFSNTVHMDHLMRNFDDVSIVKLETSRPTNCEFHVICKGFRRATRVLEYFAHSLEDVDALTVNKLRHTQEYFDNVLITGLQVLRRCLNSVGTNNFRCNKFSPDVLEGYRHRLCLPEVVSAGSLARVTRFVRRVYNTIASSNVDYRAELETEFEPPAEEEVDTDDEIEAEFNAIVEEAEAVSDSESFVTAVETTPSIAPVKPKKKKFLKRVFSKKRISKIVEAVDEFIDEKRHAYDCYISGQPMKKIVYTEIGQTNPLGITQTATPELSPPTFELRCGANVVIESKNETVDEVQESPVDTNEERPVVEKLWDHRDAMKEYLELLKYTLQSEISNHKRVLEKLSKIPTFSRIIGNENGNYKYMVKRNGAIHTIYSDPKVSYPENYSKFFVDGEFRSYDKIAELEEETKFLLSDYCEIAIEPEIIANLESIDISTFAVPEVTIVQAAAGCGKTTFIVNNSVPPHMPSPSTVLLSTCEGRDDFIARIEKKNKITLTANQKKHIRTLASYLVNHGGKNEVCEDLFIDEALMQHPGAIYFAICMSKAKRVRMLGDMLQIPYVNRTPGFVVKYDNLMHLAPVSETLYISYRCPADVCRRLNEHYLKFNSANGFPKGMCAVRNPGNTCVVKKIHNEIVPIDPEYVYLTFTQSDKKKLKTKAPRCHVSTVHEFQGKESRKIRVVRFDPFKDTEIFKRFNYALVALTRHTESLEYYTRVDTDALSKLIAVDNVTKFSAHSDAEIGEIVVERAGAINAFEYLEPAVNGSYSILPTVKKHISTIDGNRLYFVPRYGAKRNCLKKPQVMHRDAVIRKNGNWHDIFVVSSDHHLQNHNLTSIRKSLRKLNDMLPDFEIEKIYSDGSIETDVDRASLSYLLRKHLRCSVTVCSPLNEFDVPSEVFELLCKNGMNEQPNSVPVSVPVYDIRNDFAHSVSYPFNTGYAQSFINDCFGPCAFVDQSLDAYDVKTSDVNLELGDISYCQKVDYSVRQYDCMRPILHTPMPYQRDFNCRELMLALEKRNRNVPFMNGTVDFEESSDRMLENLVRECFDPEKLAVYNSEPISLSTNSVASWLAGQDECVKNMIVPDFALHNTAVNEYNFSIKRKPKPNLTVDATASYLALQTIVYHEKPINALFCSIFREIKSRIKNCLRRHIKIFCDKSPSDFEKELDSDIPVESLLALLEKLEIDISKYDKSQRELALEFECKLMTFFGVSQEIVQLWYHAHILTIVYDKVCKIKALIPYQRKSGDASTFLGNTMFLLAVLSDKIPLSEMFMVLVAGDDSLIYGFGLEKYKDTQHFGLKFNLEIKFFTFERSYFCSKFLLPIDGKWTFTPDPLKLFVKLGRNDLVNSSHVNEYRISFKDSVANFKDIRVCQAVGEAVRERYGIDYDYTSLFASLPTMCSNEVFSTLFYSELSDTIDENIQFSNNFD